MLIIAHELFLRTEDRETVIAIRIFKPEEQEKVWACRYEIEWPEGARVFSAIGFDSLQALVLALQMIGAEIYSSAYHREGRLRAYDNEKGYGFPVAASLRDLLVGADKVAM
jgi:hypothetical protein